MNARQRQVLEFVRSFSAAQKYPPTYREIGEGVGLRSLNSVKLYVDYLVTAGYLRHPARGQRAIVVVEDVSNQ